MEAIGARSDGFSGTCFSHGIWSQPSIASMMSGLYPSVHGCGCGNQILPQSITTVAERFSKDGYDTVGVSSNPYFSPTTNLDRGFDRFDFVSGKRLAREAGPAAVLSFLKNLRTFSGGMEMTRQKHSPDFLLNEIVKDRLKSRQKGGDPFFLAAHYNGVHHPYYPSPSFRPAFASDLSMSPDQAAEVAYEKTTNVYSTIAQGGFGSEDEREAVTAMYDALVRQVDALLEQLVAYIDASGLGEDTILVVTSDHGDLLGEMGLCSHKLLVHDGLINVPIVARGSETLANGDFEPMQHVDIMKTLLSELGIDTSGMHGANLAESRPETVVAQRGAETYKKTIAEVKKYNSEFHHDHAYPGFLTGLRTEEWKYVSGDGTSVLYGLPSEETDVSSKHPEIVKEFEDRLDKLTKEHGEPIDANGHAAFDEDVRSQLADLGYVVD